MNSAKAAAAASTPSVRGGVYLDSFDAKIVEYSCAIRKLEVLATHTKAVNIKVRAERERLLVLVHCVSAIAGPTVFAHDVLRRRVESVLQLEHPGDTRRVAPPVSTTPVSFDFEDTDAFSTDYEKADVNYPALVDTLLAVYENALIIYQAKLKQCILERDAHRRPDANHKPVPLDLDSFKDLLEPLEVLSLSKCVIAKDDLQNYKFKVIPLLVDSVNNTMNNLKSYVTQLETYKQKNNDVFLKKLPFWQHTIHRIFATFVKLSELYTILRKLGRNLYLKHSDELHSRKLLYNNLKLEMALKNCDEYFKNPKKNEQLVFTLSKATRQGSYFHLKNATIVELISALTPSLKLVTTLSEVLIDFIKNWELALQKEKRTKLKIDTEKIKTVMANNNKNNNDSSKTFVISPDSKKLNVLFNPEKEKLSQEAIAKQQREREKIAIEERLAREKAEKERNFSEDLRSRRKVEERERKLRNELTKDRSPPVSRSGSLRKTTMSRSRSNSNASNSSTGSNSSSSMLNSIKSESLSNSSQRSPTNLSRTPSLQRRPASVYISSPAFDIRTQLRRQEKAKANTAAALSSSGSNSPSSISSPPAIDQVISGRRRSSSLQSPSNTSNGNNNKLVAAAAGAAALKQERQHSSLNSKSELLHRYRQENLQSLQVPPKSCMKKNTNNNHRSIDHNRSSSSSRSPSPLRSKSSKNSELPDINELSISNTNLKNPSDEELKSISPINSLDPGSTSTQFTPTKSNPIMEPIAPIDSPSIKPLLKISTEPDEDDSTPDLVSNEITSESSVDIEENLPDGVIDDGDETSPKSLDTIELPPPPKIVKKVRFIGVPELEKEVKPKRKGWIHPPKNLFNANTSNVNTGNRTSLSVAADALQQERMTFHSIKRGQFDVNTGKVVFPDTKNPRIMSTLAANSGGSGRKWKLLKDRF